MNAHADILEYVLDRFSVELNDISSFGYDQNPPLHVALSLAGISKYKDRCVRCVKLILENEILKTTLDINQ